MQQISTKVSTVALLLLITLTAAQDYDYESVNQNRPAIRPQPSFSSSSGPKPTPVPILKQINRHNEDGSYTYGYEGADGTFKIETKLPTGEVKGKYGYLDDVGKVRVVEYGANRYGFQPAGEGITVAPPTLVDETTNKDGTINPEYAEQGQYYEPQPALRPKLQPQQFDLQSTPRFAPPSQIRNAAPAPLPLRAQIPNAAPVEIDYSTPRFVNRPAPASVPAFNPAPRPAPVEEDIQYVDVVARPTPRPTPIFRPAPQQVPHMSFAPSLRPTPRPSPQPVPGRGGVLDQLARDYALPQDSAAPLHDISFGYY